MTAPPLSHSTPFGRYYTHPARKKSVPSITNIKDLKAIKGLPYWAAKQCATYASVNRERLAALSEAEAWQLIRNAPWAPDPASPSHIGDIVHDWIDSHIKGEQVNPSTYIDKYSGEEVEAPAQAQNMWRQFLGIAAYYKIDWVMSEFTVWSEKHEYAGTADAAANVHGSLTLIDHKSGKSAYPDMAMQLAALSRADFILSPEGTESELPHFDRFAILHLRPMFARLIPVEHTSEWFKAFLGLKNLFDTVVACEDSTLVRAPKIQARADGRVVAA